MAKPISLAEHRWDNGDGLPSSHSPREMLETIIAKLDSGELTADHMVVAWGRINDAEEATGDDGYFQAGKFRAFAQIGLLRRVEFLMMGGGE